MLNRDWILNFKDTNKTGQPGRGEPALTCASALLLSLPNSCLGEAARVIDNQEKVAAGLDTN